MADLKRKTRMGLLLIAPQRFKHIGEGTPRGSYLERKTAEAKWLEETAGNIAEVTFPGIVFSTEDVYRAIDAFILAKTDYILALFLSWADDFTWIRFLRDMPPCPVLFCHRIRESIDLKDTHDEDEFAEFLSCGGLVGSLEASGSIARFQRPMMKTFAGTWSEIKIRAERFGQAAKACSILKDSQIGLLASMNEVMWSTYVDPYSVFKDVGPELHFLSIAQLEETLGQVTDNDTKVVMKRIAEKYQVLPNVDEEKFFASVQASIAMERLAQQHGLDLLVLNDVDNILFQRIGLRPGFWPTSPEVKTLVVPEGDVGGGIACYILKIISGQHVNYIEPFHIDLENRCFAGGHAGPNDYTDPRGKCKIAMDVRFAKTKWKHAGAPFAWYVFPEGEKTMLHCSQQSGKFQLIASRIRALHTEHFLASYSHSLFEPMDGDCRQLFSRLLAHGVTQHYGIVQGNHLLTLEDVASLLDFDFSQI